MTASEALGTCRRCPVAAVAVVSVAELDDGLAAGGPVVEAALCADHLRTVAEALGFTELWTGGRHAPTAP